MGNTHEEYDRLYEDGGYGDPCRDEELDYVDDRFLKMEVLVAAYARNPDKTSLTPESARFYALWLHRWIMYQRQAQIFEKRIEKGVLAYVYGAQTSRETLTLQRKAAHEIFISAGLINKRIGATALFTNLGPALEDAYKEIINEVKENATGISPHLKNFLDDFNNPSWDSIRDSVSAHMAFLQEIASRTTKKLRTAKGKMGQPPKKERDALFVKWQKEIASDLNMSFDDSIHFASKSWGIYFPTDPIKEDAAEKIVKTHRARARGK